MDKFRDIFARADVQILSRIGDDAVIQAVHQATEEVAVFGDDDTLTLAHPQVSAVVVMSADQEYEFEEGSDFSFDDETGVVTRDPDGAIPGEAEVSVSYSWAETTQVKGELSTPIDQVTISRRMTGIQGHSFRLPDSQAEKAEIDSILTTGGKMFVVVDIVPEGTGVTALSLRAE